MSVHSDPPTCSFLYSLAATLFVVSYYAIQGIVLHVRGWM